MDQVLRRLGPLLLLSYPIFWFGIGPRAWEAPTEGRRGQKIFHVWILLGLRLLVGFYASADDLV